MKKKLHRIQIDVDVLAESHEDAERQVLVGWLNKGENNCKIVGLQNSLVLEENPEACATCNPELQIPTYWARLQKRTYQIVTAEFFGLKRTCILIGPKHDVSAELRGTIANCSNSYLTFHDTDKESLLMEFVTGVAPNTLFAIESILEQNMFSKVE